MTENSDLQPSESVAPQTTVSGARVPAILHQFWFGRERDDAEAMMGWARRIARASGWQYIRWTLQDALDRFPRLADCLMLCRTVSQMSNAVRFYAIAEMGGLYLDADIMLRRLPEALTGAWILLERSGLSNPAVLAAPPGHPFARELVNVAHTNLFYNSDRQGVGVATWVAERYRGPGMMCWTPTHWASHLPGSHATDGEYGTHLFRRDDWRSARPKDEP